MKPYRICTIAVILILCLGLISSSQWNAPQQQKSSDQAPDFHQIFPDAKGFRRAKTDVPLYEALGPNQRLLGYAFQTDNFVPEIKGHGGAIKMLVALDRSGKILDLKIAEHQETLAYLQKLPDFLDRIIGTSTLTPFVLNENIDGISGATITSQAIISMLNQAAQKIHTNVNLRSPEPPMPDLKKPVLGILIFMLAIFAWFSRKAAFRWAALTASFVILGLIYTEVVSVSHIAGLVLRQFPSWHQNPLIYILLGGAVLSSILFGRVFCAGVCPFAFVQESLHWVKRKLIKTSLTPSEKTDAVIRWIKYIFLLLSLTACIGLKRSGLAAEEVYITLFTMNTTAGAMILLIIVLIFSFFFLRFWCRYFCPFGAFLGLCAQSPIIKNKCGISSDKSVCTDASECFYCDRCLQADFMKSTPAQNRAFLLAVTICSALFLATFLQPLLELPRQQPTTEKMLATTPAPFYSDVEKVKEQLNKAGITPHPAKYWRTIDHD